MDMHMIPDHEMDDLEISITRRYCKAADPDGCDYLDHHYIEACSASLDLESLHFQAGHIWSNIIHHAAMNRLDPSKFWDACRSYDETHVGSKLNKVENYLANESFPSHRDTQIKESEIILYIEEVVIDPAIRGKGRGLEALEQLIEQLQLPRKTVVLLQAGPIGSEGPGGLDAGDKIAAHWRRLGFEEWSETDDSWLCLSLEDNDGQLRIRSR